MVVQHVFGEKGNCPPWLRCRSLDVITRCTTVHTVVPTLSPVASNRSLRHVVYKCVRFHVHLLAISPDVLVCARIRASFFFFLFLPDYIHRSPFHFPATSRMGSSEQLSVSLESEIRVRLQSVPLPPLLMLQARARAAGSPAATQIQPAKARTQAPGRQSATVCHFNPPAPTGASAERRTKGGSERGEEGGRPRREKEHPRAEGSFCDM